MNPLKVFQAKKGNTQSGTLLVLTPYEGEVIVVAQNATSDVVQRAAEWTVDTRTEYLPDVQTGRAWAEWFEAHRPAVPQRVELTGDGDLPNKRNELIKVAKELGVGRAGSLTSDQLRVQIVEARRKKDEVAEVESADREEEVGEEEVVDLGGLGDGAGELTGDLGGGELTGEVVDLGGLGDGAGELTGDLGGGELTGELGGEAEELVQLGADPEPQPAPEPKKPEKSATTKKAKPEVKVKVKTVEVQPETVTVRKRVGAGCKQPDAVKGWAPGRLLQVARPHREREIGTVEYVVRCEEDGGYRLVTARLIGKGKGRPDLREGRYWPYVSLMLHDLMMTRGKRHHKMTLPRFFKL